MSKSTSNKSSRAPRSSSSTFLLLILVANKPADPLTRAELRQLLCRRNPRYSPRYQLVHQLCLFDPLADSPSCLRCIFSVRKKKKKENIYKCAAARSYCASSSCRAALFGDLLKCVQTRVLCCFAGKGGISEGDSPGIVLIKRDLFLNSTADYALEF